MVENVRYVRACGHVNDAVIFTVSEDNMVRVFCVECLMAKLGIEPSEVMSLEEFGKRYGGKKQ
jgi:hypothetical protein